MTTAPTPQPEALRLASLLTAARSFDYARIGTDARFVEIRSAQALEIAQELARLQAENECLRAGLEPRQPLHWEPQFDVMAPGQEDLAIQFCAEIAGPRGKPGRNPDPVRLLEMAQALYKAEADAHMVDRSPNLQEPPVDKAANLQEQPTCNPLPPTDMTPAQLVNALVGDRLTAQKVEAICAREPYAVTGVVLSQPDGRACIVNQSAVRWFHGAGDFWNLMHVGQP